MNHSTPERLGISSADVLRFVQQLDKYHLSTHSVILSRGDEVFAECYYAPFHKDFLHRMYSTSKSMVSLAVGFCEQDGLLSLDDPIDKFFPEYKDLPYHPDTTVREMLQMRTSHPSCDWFNRVQDDRAALYFMRDKRKHPGTIFSYDSQGSFMLGAMVENVTGKPFVEYLKEKVFNEIGAWQNAYALKCPGGHSWGDSGVMCTARDLWYFARFVLNGGTWNGKRYLNEAYLKDATKTCVPNNPFGFVDYHDLHGYGYKFWGTAGGCFATLGMGNQMSLCDPENDLIMVITSDNQGNPNSYEQIVQTFLTHIKHKVGAPLPEDPAAKAELDAYLASRKLFTLTEAKTSPMAEKISGRRYECEENACGIKWFQIDLDGEEGKLLYENEQGEKCIPFGFGHNVFAKFPEQGYSDEVGAKPAPGNYYDAAASADWPDEQTLRIRVQIIDKYFANLAIVVGWRDEDTVSILMQKKAEGFLDKYDGYINCKL